MTLIFGMNWHEHLLCPARHFRLGGLARGTRNEIVIGLGVLLVNRGVILFKLSLGMDWHFCLMHLDSREPSWEDWGRIESSGALTRTGGLEHMYVRRTQQVKESGNAPSLSAFAVPRRRGERGRSPATEARYQGDGFLYVASILKSTRLLFTLNTTCCAKLRQQSRLSGYLR